MTVAVRARPVARPGSRLPAVWLPLVGAATAVALWWLVTVLFDIRPFFLPAPPDVVASFLKNPPYMMRES